MIRGWCDGDHVLEGGARDPHKHVRVHTPFLSGEDGIVHRRQAIFVRLHVFLPDVFISNEEEA